MNSCDHVAHHKRRWKNLECAVNKDRMNEVLCSSIQSIQSQIWHRTRQAQSIFSMLHKNIHSHYTLTFNQVSEWFKQNSLFLNINKIYFTHFHSKGVAHSNINITYENNYNTKVNDLKFLGLNINDTLTWNSHIETILHKLSSACLAMKSIKPLISQLMLKAIYYSV